MGAWHLGGALRVVQRGVIEPILAWALLGISLVIGAGVALSAVGALGQPGYLAVHAAVLALVALGRRRHLGSDWSAAKQIWTRTRAQCAASRIDAIVTAGVVTVVGTFTLLACLAQPDVMDAVTYHLPRAAQWLQDGRVHFLNTADERLNFVTPLPEVMMGWFLTATRAGFHLAMVPQAIGGAMTLVATIGLARKTGVSPLGAGLAAVLLLAMQNVVAQFTACQTDLFTTGIFSASFYLWWTALERDEGSWLAGFGVMLAVGAKGTLYYLAPGALIWVVWLLRRHGFRRRTLTSTVLGALVGVGAMLGPIWVRNVSAYGSPLAPPNWTERVHRRPDSIAELADKLTWNLRTSLAQNFSFTSQPDGLRAISARIGEAIADRLPDHDRFTLDGIKRRSVVRGVIARQTPDVDATSFGLVVLLLFTIGMVGSIARIRQSSAQLTVVWASGVVVFLVFLHAMQVWHPFVFRYLVLAAPWIAIVAASTGDLLTGKARVLFAVVAVVAAVDVAARTTLATPQCGWRSVVAPQRALPWFVTESWRNWSERQLDAPHLPLRLALPEERPLAAFYRTEPRRVVELERSPSPDVASAEAFVQNTPGWVIVPARQFLGREGRVFGRTWLFRGDDASPFSIAAFRRLTPGESPPPMLYRHLVETRPIGFVHHLWVKNWRNPSVSFVLTNPTTAEVSYRFATPTAARDGRLAPGQGIVRSIPMDSDAVSEVMVEFILPSAKGPGSAAPSVELADSTGE